MDFEAKYQRAREKIDSRALPATVPTFAIGDDRLQRDVYGFP
jgi:hypothetical protein